jgi:beta-lactamase superfamily II metal-dependent hydrolase
MKLSVYPSNKGDCLLVSGKDGGRMLVDGGMTGSYRDYVAPALAELQARGEHLDVVYVSHIDEDHIAGVLRLMDDLLAWRVFDYQSRPETNNPQPKVPRSPRPPEVKAVWHNGFDRQLGKNSGRIEEMLSASATILSGADEERIRQIVLEQRDIVTGVAQAVTLSYRLGADQLNIPINPDYGGKLMAVDARRSVIRFGSLSITVIGPSKARLEQLRKEWNDWLRANRETLSEIEDEAKNDRLPPPTGSLATAAPLIAPMLAQTQALAASSSVTVPNLASLMLLVEEGERRLLLTGDGIAEDILAGLKRCRKLDRNGRIHVDVLKVQHHGATANITQAFCEAVTADHYVFCGNGAHHNPEPDVVAMIVAARLAAPAGSGPGADRPFKLWFNSSESFAETESRQRHMKRIETDVRRLAATADGRMEFAFITDPEWADRKRFELTISG